MRKQLNPLRKFCQLSFNMRIALLLLVFPLSTSAYNLQVENAIIHTAPSSDKKFNQSSRSFFGYSVLLYSKKLNSSPSYQSWMIVGAPKANYTGQIKNKTKIPEELGVVYVCELPGDCEAINVPDPQDRVLHVYDIANTFIMKQDYGWFGASMSLYENDGSLTVCAPRISLEIYDNETIFENTMQGACYNGNLSSRNLSIEDEDFSNYDFNGIYWSNPLNGFAVHYPRSQVSSESLPPIVGSPTHEVTGTLHKMGQQEYDGLWNYSSPPDFPLFGYAISSGYYFNKSKLMVAGGAPEWEYVGQVAIMDYHQNTTPHSFISTISGTEMGEYFGASLTTGDMDNDGLDDLIVGAPHWNNDNGRVYIYLGKEDGFFKADILLTGIVDDALYGYALTCGDLDGDHLDDLIVAAPWEETGVIYVYNGNAMLHKLDSIEASQRITGYSVNSDILTFGFSLSKIHDIDGNGFSDVAVGACVSEHAVLLKSEPIVKTAIILSTIPSILLRNSTSFLLTICRNQIPNKNWHGEITITVDKLYNRVYESVYKSEFTEPESCDNITIFLQNNVSNYLDDIEIVAEHKFLELEKLDTLTKKSSGNLCPVEYKNKNATAKKRLLFYIDCGMNRICQSFILAELVFPGIRNSTYMIGSNDLELVLIIENKAENAYSTYVTFNIPKGISLKKIWPTCRENEDRQALKVTCDVGNPLERNSKKNISLILDAKTLRNPLLVGTKLHFTVDIKTRSANHGNSTVAISLQLKANVSVALTGNTRGDIMYYESNVKSTNLVFQNNYHIWKYGVTPISGVVLKILVPYKLGDTKFLTIAYNPRDSSKGLYYECSVSDVPISEDGIITDKLSNKLTTENHSRNRRQASSKDNLTRSFLKANATYHTTLANNRSQLQSDEIILAELYKKLKVKNANIIYVNCSTPNIICGQVTCKIYFHNMTYDFVPLQLIADISKLTDVGKRVVNFATEATVHVENTKLPFKVPGTGIPIRSTTIFCRTRNASHDSNIFRIMVKNYNRPSDEIDIRMILGSVLLGLLILGLCAVTLRHLGFFERKKKKRKRTLSSEEPTAMNMYETPQKRSDTAR